jgi:hypothetical protein
MVVGRRTTSMAAVLASLGAVSCASNVNGPVPTVRPIVDGSSSAPQPVAETPATSQQAVPAYLSAACGHPGVQATLPAVPITIPRAECDLTGVVVIYGQDGVTVPSTGGVLLNVDAITGSSEFSADVDPTTGDVTFTDPGR